MSRTKLEVADIFRGQGPAWRQANAGHVSLEQLKVMSAIENCRTAELGGHVVRCENETCGHTEIGYNSCRNRHCPKCQGAAAREWLAEREAELLPVPHFHVVFSLPAQIADIAYQNKAAIYDILFKASAETMLTIAADPKHLGARIGILSVLHTWGSALTHHPHVHMIVPGGGISLDGTRWVACRPNFLLAVEVLSCLFRRLVLEKLAAVHRAGELQFFGKHVALTNPKAFAAYLAPLRNQDWVVYAKRPFGGPEQVLRYLARYTHRVAISNRRLISADDNGVTFKWKDYRLDGAERYNRVMTLDTSEFIRRFLMHVLPSGFHRIRYYGFLTCQTRAKNIERIRQLLAVPLIPLEDIEAASPRLRRALSPRSPKHQCIHALAAAATCASSRPSCAGNSRNTNPRQFRQRSGSTPHDDGTDARHMQIRPMSVLASSRQRYPLRRYVNVAVRRHPKAQDCVTKTIRDPFTTQFTPMPRDKITYLAASFRHINACARGEIPIVAAPPPFPTRDFLPWRFSAAGRRSAWRDRHPGSRKPTQTRKSPRRDF